MTCENPDAEIRSAQIILDQAMKGLEALEVENRIERLEATIVSLEEEVKRINDKDDQIQFSD